MYQLNEKLNTYISENGKKLDKNGLAFKFDEFVYGGLTLKYGDETVGEILEKENTTVNACFYSYILALAMPNATLVKGTICIDESQFKIPHAWVEKDGFIYDVAFKRVFYKDFYEKFFKVDYSIIVPGAVFKTNDNKFSIGLQFLSEQPEMIERFLEFKEFKSLKKKEVEKQLNLIKNEKICKKVAECFDIETTLGYNI